MVPGAVITLLSSHVAKMTRYLHYPGLPFHGLDRANPIHNGGTYRHDHNHCFWYGTNRNFVKLSPRQEHCGWSFLLERRWEELWWPLLLVLLGVLRWWSDKSPHTMSPKMTSTTSPQIGPETGWRTEMECWPEGSGARKSIFTTYEIDGRQANILEM